MSAPPVLDVLYEARARVLDPDEPYNYFMYQFCGVGHLFRAATGRYGDLDEVRSEPIAPEYVDVIATIADAVGDPLTGYDGETPAGEAALRISMATGRERVARGLPPIRALYSDSREERMVAATIYERAIAALTERDAAEGAEREPELVA